MPDRDEQQRPVEIPRTAPAAPVEAVSAGGPVVIAPEPGGALTEGEALDAIRVLPSVSPMGWSGLYVRIKDIDAILARVASPAPPALDERDAVIEALRCTMDPSAVDMAGFMRHCQGNSEDAAGCPTHGGAGARADAVLAAGFRRPAPPVPAALAEACSTCGGTGRVDWEPGAMRNSEEPQQPCPDCAPAPPVPAVDEAETVVACGNLSPCVEKGAHHHVAVHRAGTPETELDPPAMQQIDVADLTGRHLGQPVRLVDPKSRQLVLGTLGSVNHRRPVTSRTPGYCTIGVRAEGWRWIGSVDHGTRIAIACTHTRSFEERDMTGHGTRWCQDCRASLGTITPPDAPEEP